MPSINTSIEFDKDLYEKIASDYESGNYTSAIKTAILYISEEIRERTNLDLDGDQLITKAFSINNPLLKINSLETQTEKDEQTGYMLLFQGMYKAIRNPRNHNLIVDKKKEGESLLIVLNYMLSVIERARPRFDYKDFLALINDRYFVKTNDYANEIAKTLPKEKILDIVMQLCNDIAVLNYRNVPYIVKVLKDEMSGKDKEVFFNSCNTVLGRIEDFTKLRAYIVFLSSDWKLLNKAVRLRLIEILLGSLNNFDFKWDTTTDENGNYQNYEYLDEDGDLCTYLKYLPHEYSNEFSFITIKSIIDKKMRMGEKYAKHILQNIHYIFCDKNDVIYPAFEDLLIELLGNGYECVYSFLESETGEPLYQYSEKLSNAIKSYIEVKSAF
jgi:uncharacterized protein (TIGR02391 family)